MKRREAIFNRIKSEYNRKGQTAEPVFDTMMSASKVLSLFKITNEDGVCYAVHENSDALEAFETRQEADAFTKEWFNTSFNL